MKAVQSNRRQRGITLMSFIIVMAVLGFFGYIGAKLWGPFYEFSNVKSSMESVAKEPGADTMDIGNLRKMLQKRFDVGYVENISAEQAELVKDKNVNKLKMTYEARTSFIANIDFVIKFDHSVNLGIPAAN
jgi:hypothetical protein